MNILNELFLSEKRQLVDKELKRIANEHVNNSQLRDNILYHLCLDEDIKPTLEHSKRLRAYLCLLFAEEAGHNIADIVPLAVVVELLHNSTLVIDDIQDNSPMRCGKTALWQKVGLANAINASYFLGLFSQSYFEIQRQKYGYWNYSNIFVKTVNKLISGQQTDINADAIKNKTVETYFEIAKGKTGALLNLTCHFGCMPYDYNQKKMELLTEFADIFACTYQIFDDLNDLNGYLQDKKAILDSSNIYYFVSNNQTLSKQTIKETIPEIIEYKNRLLLNIFQCIDLFKDNKIITTNKLQLIINDILK
jgi:geranylgeranyl pyrophosphate synthase